MGTYGRNFDFRITPEWNQRFGRYVLDNGSDLAIGTPIGVANGATQDSSLTGALPCHAITGATAIPKPGFGGILVYEHLDLNQLDPLYYTYSDRSTAPDGKMVQLVSGKGIKVVFRNTVDRTVADGNAFLNTREYDGRIMVAGFGATPTLAIGDFLTPGVGDDTSGYWAETGTAANAWLVITGLDHARGEVEAMMLF